MVIKKKSDRNWEYCVYLGQDENGKKKYKRKCGFKTKKECVLEASIFENKDNKNIHHKTLENIFLLYLKDKESKGLKITTLNTIKSGLNRIKNNFKFSNSYVDLITQEHINNFIHSNYFLNLAPQTKNLLFFLFKSIFTFAVKQNIIKNNVFDNIPSIKKDHTIRKIWNETELKNYLPILKHFQYFDIVLLALETGMRKGEILGLTWECINFKKGTLLIEKTIVKTKNYFGFHTPKTRAGIREIVLFEDSLNILKNKYKNRLSDFVFHECDNPSKPICPIKLTICFRKFLKKHNIKHIHFHDLRHIHATFLLNNKVDYKILSRRLGHTNIAFTLQTYTHILPENEKRALSNLPTLI